MKLQQRVEAQLHRIIALIRMWDERSGEPSILAMRAAVIDVIAANATIEETCVEVLRGLTGEAIAPKPAGAGRSFHDEIKWDGSSTFGSGRSSRCFSFVTNPLPMGFGE